MSQCEDIRRELEAFLCDDVDETKRNEIQHHLEECQECSEVLRQLKKLAGVLQTWREIEPSPMMYEKLKARLKKPESAWNRIFTYAYGKRVALRFAQVATIVMLTLLISNLLQKPAPKVSEDLAIIDFYLKEHQGVVVQTVSADLLTQPATKMKVDQDNIIYFEFFDNHPKFTKSGIILKGIKNRHKIRLPKAPAITKGQILSFPQVREAVHFDPVMPPQLPHEYILDSIRKIDNYNSLHLLYTKGIKSLSLFEQPSKYKEGLSSHDFREYAVYSTSVPDVDINDEGEATILSWSNGKLSFVLIGKADMSQLMDIVHAISSAEGQGINGRNTLVYPEYSPGYAKMINCRN
jgi:hypothetical protein